MTFPKVSCLTYCGAISGGRRDRPMGSWLDSGSLCFRSFKFLLSLESFFYSIVCQRAAVYSFCFASNSFKENYFIPNYQFPIWRKQTGRKVFSQSQPPSTSFFILQSSFMSPLCTIDFHSSSLPDSPRHSETVIFSVPPEQTMQKCYAFPLDCKAR